VIQFDALGLPVPKGSLKAFTPKGWTRPVLTSTSVGLKDWAAVVRYQAQSVAPGTLYPDGVAVWLAFRLPRPKALPKAKLTPHTKKPDLDKLIRAVLDALSGVLFTDDSQVVQLTCSKRYAALGEAPGVAVRLESSTGPGRLSGLEPSAAQDLNPALSESHPWRHAHEPEWRAQANARQRLRDAALQPARDALALEATLAKSER
jgi:crossover junction endodeoxyribonuclease RusA